ncbi:hypothetical protein LV779_27805 [Streptomyces thinghirensis]|nr:hypothetical protein [Streptomyces thinghirensis]
MDTGYDGDGDGEDDRVAVDIVRPREPAQQGRKIPVIMDASPYYSCCGRGNESQKKTYDADGDVDGMPLYYDNYLVPRGYAFVGVDLAGTNRSDGCVDVGGRSDVQSAEASRRLAERPREGVHQPHRRRERARATWTNGRTGMIGKSWDGTIANGVAATGVEGLETIVPIAAISSWYDYYFSQGAPLYGSGPDWLSDYVNSPDARDRCDAVQHKLVDGAPRTGDWTRLWTERDYVKAASKVEGERLPDPRHAGPQRPHAARRPVVERPSRRTASTARSGSPDRPRRPPSTSDAPSGSTPCTAGSTTNSSATTTASTASPWPTSNAGPSSGRRRRPGRRVPPPPRRCAPPTAARPGVGTLGLRRDRGTETFTDDPALNETDWAAHIDEPTPG